MCGNPERVYQMCGRVFLQTEENTVVFSCHVKQRCSIFLNSVVKGAYLGNLVVINLIHEGFSYITFARPFFSNPVKVEIL